VTIGEGWNVDRPVNGELCLSGQLLFTRTTRLSISLHLTLTHEQDSEILELHRLGQALCPHLDDQSTGFWQSTITSDVEVVAANILSMKITNRTGDKGMK